MKRTIRGLFSLLLTALLLMQAQFLLPVSASQPDLSDIESSSTITIPFHEINNIAIFLKFPSTLYPDNEFINPNSLSLIDTAYNTGDRSLKTYLNQISYGDVTVNTHYYPKDASGNVYSVEAPNRIYYYNPPFSAGNTEGYTTDAQKEERRQELVLAALDEVKAQLEADFTGADLDKDNDGNIDSIQIFMDTHEIGGRITFGDLLWPVKTIFEGNYTIAGKKVSSYNFINTSKLAFNVASHNINSGVIAHEFFHTLGLPDLYDYTNETTPVGTFDLMSTVSSLPQAILQYMQREYCGWGTKIDTLTQDGTYTLKKAQYQDAAIDGGANNTPETAYILRSPFSETEFFVIQCANVGMTGSSTDGIIIYRINTRASTSPSNEYPNFLYLWRENDTAPIPSIYSPIYLADDCVFSLERGRTCVGKARGEESPSIDTATLYFSDGTNSGIVIRNIGSGLNDTISFEITFPIVSSPSGGSGTMEEPYLLTSPDQLRYVQLNPDKCYRLINDLNMADATIKFEPIKNFTGTFDGNHKRIFNFNFTSDSGFSAIDFATTAFFDSIASSGTVQDLTFVNPQITNHTRGNTAVLAGNLNGTAQNIQILGGNVVSDSSLGVGTGAGGIASSCSGRMEQCFSSACVSGYSVGGLTCSLSGTVLDSYCTGTLSGTVMGGIAGTAMGTIEMENVFFSGSVPASENAGGIFGLARFTPATHFTFRNVYWDTTASGVQTYAGVIENYTGSPEPPAVSGITGVGLPAAVSFTDTTQQQLAVTTVPATTPVTGVWGTDPFYGTVSVSAAGLVTPLLDGVSPVTFTINVGGNPMVLSCNVSTQANLPAAPKTLITRKDSTYALLNGATIRTTLNHGVYTTVQIIDGITMVPARFVAETMGLTVDWDESTSNTVITNPKTGEYVTIQIGSNAISKYAADGTLLYAGTMPAPAASIDGSTYIPVRIVSECLGFQVEYREHTDKQSYIIISNRSPVWSQDDITALCDSASGKI